MRPQIISGNETALAKKNREKEQAETWCEKCEYPGTFVSIMQMMEYQERHIYCPNCEHYRKIQRTLGEK